jgi:hypothetical protein
MPWKECSVMDERLQFVARRLEGLTDRSRRPYRYANQLPFQVENFILNVKREHTTWGARKIRERLIRRFSGIPIPAKSTRPPQTFCSSRLASTTLSTSSTTSALTKRWT